MKFDEMLKKAKESGGTTEPTPPAATTPPAVVPAERTHLTAEEKEMQAEQERDQAILEKKYPKMKAALDNGGLDKQPIMPS